jgi:hypothetical protein
MFSVAATHNPMLITLRNFLAPRVLPQVLGKRSRRARAFRFVSQLAIKYPDSSIVDEDLHGADPEFRHGPAAGNRAPDGPLLLAGDGRQTSLFSCTRRSSHHLLLFGGQDPSADGWSPEPGLRELAAEYQGLLEPHLILVREPVQAEIEVPVYVDESGLVHERYGLKGAGVYLIRPDGFVAFRAPGSDLRPVRAYLQRMFPSSSLAPAEASRS